MLPTIWDPFETLSVIENRMDDLFGNLDRFHPVVTRSPSIDVSEDDKKFMVRAEVPGIDPNDIHLAIEDHHLTLRGEKKSEAKEKKGNGHLTERFFGSFSKTFYLPETVNTKKVKATLRNGVLEITLPKRAVAKPKKIQIQMN
ncbi:MAG: Hsp20 family protein [Proteobacteria bacterium]|nr:Hsp20 family protein [Pseudomonadota bacterium]